MGIETSYARGTDEIIEDAYYQAINETTVRMEEMLRERLDTPLDEIAFDPRVLAACATYNETLARLRATKTVPKHYKKIAPALLVKSYLSARFGRDYADHAMREAVKKLMLSARRWDEMIKLPTEPLTFLGTPLEEIERAA